MKKCMKCGADVQDDAVFCTHCGAKVENGDNINQNQTNTNQNQANMNQNQANMNQGMYNGGNASQGGPQYYAPPVDIYDHTAEFDQKDIADNKVIAMVAYLLGTIGVIIALLAAQSSKYAAFHVRQALKFTVIEVLIGIVTLILFWTFIVPIAGGIMLIILFVVRIICFFSICKGKAKEAPIIRSFAFLN